jgi:hypothetical protein
MDGNVAVDALAEGQDVWWDKTVWQGRAQIETFMNTEPHLRPSHPLARPDRRVLSQRLYGHIDEPWPAGALSRYGARNSVSAVTIASGACSASQ